MCIYIYIYVTGVTCIILHILLYYILYYISIFCRPSASSASPSTSRATSAPSATSRRAPSRLAQNTLHYINIVSYNYLKLY